MKFAKNLARNQVPEWASEYINYKGLKKLIKSATDDVKQGEEADLAEFFFSLDRNLETVDGFYNRKYGDASRRLKLLQGRYGNDKGVASINNKHDAEELITALLELRSQLRKLQWYGEVNRRGFVKITKKLDKKVATACVQRSYLLSRVDHRPFALNSNLAHDVNDINDWLSALGDLKISDDSSSTHSTVSAALSRRGSGEVIKIPAERLHELDRAVNHDDATALSKNLKSLQEDEQYEGWSFQKASLNLLQRAISLDRKNCIASLLQSGLSLEEDDDINRRNCIHRLVISIGRDNRDPCVSYSRGSPNTIVPAEAPSSNPAIFTYREADSTRPVKDAQIKLLVFILDNLASDQRESLASTDALGRMPLHYAAQHGSVILCKVILEHMKKWNQFDPTNGIDNDDWKDNDGDSPLHLSVIGKHPETTKTLLDFCIEPENHSVNGESENLRCIFRSANLLSLATKANSIRIVQLLVERGADINSQDEQGENALHIASRFGYLECAQAISTQSPWYRPDLDLTEITFGWTPLMVASVDGHLDLVKYLINAGSSVNKADTSGWTAKEHAALRGHIKIAEFLDGLTPKISSPALKPGDPNSNPPRYASLNDRASSGIGKENIAPSAPAPVKSFGHRYLTDETMILVSLGSMDYRKNVEPVKLDNIPLAAAHATQLDTALSLIVSSTGANGEPTTFDLPVQENVSTDPIAFTTKDIKKVKLLFDLVPTYSGTKDNVVGRGVAMLSSIKANIGDRRMNLQTDLSVPIIAAKTLDYIGVVTFNFLIITPFSHPNISITETQTYWKSLTSPMVIGHRGLGKNQTSLRSLQLGENTIQSFIAAANLGASYVEFDVQLTKDHVPVIYHDFLVSETGIDAPVHALTLEQFMHINDSSSRNSRTALSTNDRNNTSSSAQHPKNFGRINRANSMGATDELRTSNMKERMKHTRDFKLKGYKGNSRGDFIQAPFTTLEEMLNKLPENIGFNIEMKYPMLHESEEEEMDTYAIELNSFVDAVLEKIYDLGNKRDIIFSSFNPDMCLLLSLKQPSIPILFLSDAGTYPVGDIRASSLQEAIRFASRWNLLGVVSAAEPLVTCPRLVKVVKESGLVCVSYGTLNNDPVNVKLQVKEGIDAVIVDNVLAIRKGLTHSEADDDSSKETLDQIVTKVNGVELSGASQHAAVV